MTVQKIYMTTLYDSTKNLFYQWREPWLRNITQSAWCNISVSVSLFLHAWVPLSNRPHTAAEALGRSQSCLEDTFSTTTWKLPALRIWPSETPFFTDPSRRTANPASCEVKKGRHWVWSQLRLQGEFWSHQRQCSQTTCLQTTGKKRAGTSGW